MHVDRIRKLRGWDSVELSAAPSSRKAEATTKKKYEVEEIRGQRKADGQTQYLVKWKTYSDHTWEPVENLVHCPVKIETWMKLLAKEKQAKTANATRAGIAAHVQMLEAAESERQVRALMAEANMIQMDLSKCRKKKMLKQICAAAGIRMKEVAAVWAGPPCETYSPADATNISRGNEQGCHDGHHDGGGPSCNPSYNVIPS